ncbi:MAG TPA: hypothetical protein VFA63_00635 [Pseudonocardiaceae bacterium]|nr:hypothetical protein [Pseudonocardiaceae bacterium]
MESSTVEEFRSTVRNLNVFDGVALLIALGLTGVGFLIGTMGSNTAPGSTSSVDLTITADDQVRPLAPGATAEFPLYVNNPNNYGVRVDSISAGRSKATSGGCPAGTVTSAPVNGPVGHIKEGGVRAYLLSVTMAATTDSRCKGQTFTLPLTIKFATATSDR